MLFLRAEQGDADVIAPSLYAGRGGSRRRAAEAEAEEAGTAEEVPARADEAPDSGGLPVDDGAGLPVTRPFTS